MYFTQTHEWIQVDGKIGTVGISDHAQKELGEIVYIELPKVGQKVNAGEEISVLESTKAAADIYSPVSGKVTSVNEQLKQTPSLINKLPQSTWLYKIELTHPAELNDLLSHQDYLKSIS